ncbi:MAG TPA: hypothetical protein VGT41_03890 [Candidatus Babeliales bacterium]|nr:hypothetical protein [Candidatus Babeliales bacterium]
MKLNTIKNKAIGAILLPMLLISASTSAAPTCKFPLEAIRKQICNANSDQSLTESVDSHLDGWTSWVTSFANMNNTESLDVHLKRLELRISALEQIKAKAKDCSDIIYKLLSMLCTDIKTIYTTLKNYNRSTSLGDMMELGQTLHPYTPLFPEKIRKFSKTEWKTIFKHRIKHSR